MDIQTIISDENALKRVIDEHRIFKDAIENSPIQFCVYDQDDNLIAWNKSFEESNAEAFSRARMDTSGAGLNFRHVAEAQLAATVPVAGLQRAVDEWVLQHRMADAVPVEQKFAGIGWVRSIKYPLSMGAVAGMSIDINEVVEAKRSAENAERAKTEFLANMSHEIRTPMNGVLGMAELLCATELGTKQKVFADIILKSGNALLNIINDILDFSKLDAGQMVLVPEPFRLSEAIEDVATLVSTRVSEKDLELIVRIQPDLPDVLIGDIGRIRQIVTNLLGNAVKFTESGHVLVEVTGSNNEGMAALKFAIQDTGIGIPEDKVAMMFEKFSQIDTTSTRRHEGTGLGLAISKSLVELMDGEIGAYSVVGEGSTFWFSIELPVDATAPRKKTAPSDITGSKILIVDDNHVNRTILLEQITSWRMDSAAVESGPLALEMLVAARKDNVQVDAIILDYHMPEMNGAEVARILRDDPRFCKIPVILLTSMDVALEEGPLCDLKVAAHLMKPARSSLLLETIVEVIHENGQAARPQGIATLQTNDTGLLGKPSPKNALPPAPPANGPGAALDAGQAGEKSISLVPGNRAAQRIDVLVAEDNQVNQMVVSHALKELNITVKLVENGMQAVEAFKQTHPRVVIMDVSMPEMNGYEATRAIREYEKGSARKVPIIGCTAHALNGDREKCLDAGMDDYVSKPISPKHLQAKILEWMKNLEHLQVTAK